MDNKDQANQPFSLSDLYQLFRVALNNGDAATAFAIWQEGRQCEPLRPPASVTDPS